MAELALQWALQKLSEGGVNSPIHRTMAGAVEKRANGAYWQEALSGTDAYKLTLEAREAATDDAEQPFEYTVQWRGNEVLYRNLIFDPSGPITDEEKQDDVRCDWLPDVTAAPVADTAPAADPIARAAWVAQARRAARARRAPLVRRVTDDAWLGDDDDLSDDEEDTSWSLVRAVRNGLGMLWAATAWLEDSDDED